jgi:ankyrin repeat protein
MNVLDNMHWTPLLRAGHTACNGAALALIELGADVHFTAPKDRWGLPAGSNVLHAFCYRNETKIEVVNALLDCGVNATLEDSKGQTALDVARANSVMTVVNVLTGRA